MKQSNDAIISGADKAKPKIECSQDNAEPTNKVCTATLDRAIFYGLDTEGLPVPKNTGLADYRFNA